MWPPAERVVIEIQLAEAHQRAQADTPFSPTWDAAMARVEDLERTLWRIDHPDPRHSTPVDAR